MNELAKIGKKNTLLISLSVLLVSLHTIYLYHAVKPGIETGKLGQQIIRFLLTLGLLILVYKGKNWARIVSLVLFSLGLIGALIGFGALEVPFVNKIPLLVMVFVYAMALYHFGFSKSYKAFFEFQNATVEDSEMNLTQLMNSKKFWSIIETTKLNSGGDYEKQQSELKKELLQLTPREVFEFDNTFRTLRGQVYHWDFWAAAYIINGGCSDDCFYDFRDWLIGQGQALFEKAVENIETLSELNETNDGDWEGLSFIATEVYEQKTNKTMPNGVQENLELAGEEWEEDETVLKNRYPKLWAKFGEK